MNLNLYELNKIKEIVEEVGVEYFKLTSSNESGIGRILTMTYETTISNYPAEISIEISGVENW